MGPRGSSPHLVPRDESASPVNPPMTICASSDCRLVPSVAEVLGAARNSPPFFPVSTGRKTAFFRYRCIMCETDACAFSPPPFPRLFLMSCQKVDVTRVDIFVPVYSHPVFFGINREIRKGLKLSVKRRCIPPDQFPNLFLVIRTGSKSPYSIPY